MRKIVLFAFLALPACDRAEQPKPPTAAESEQLNQAEAMLDELAKEEGAAPQGTTPSNSD